MAQPSESARAVAGREAQDAGALRAGRMDITVETLRRVEAAETFLRGLGFREFSVHHHDTQARLEIPREEVPRLWEDGRHEMIVARFREIGYHYVAVDLQGFNDGPSQTQPAA